MVRPRVTVFEGLDRSGKTTLCRAYAEATGQLHACLDRWVVSCNVYDRFFGREHEVGWVGCWREQIEDQLKDFGLVYVFVDTPPEVCYIRGAEYTVDQLDVQRQMFLDEIAAAKSKRGVEAFIVQTTMGESNHTVEELVISCRRHLGT